MGNHLPDPDGLDRWGEEGPFPISSALVVSTNASGIITRIPSTTIDSACMPAFAQAREYVGTVLTVLRREGRGWILLTVASGWLLTLGLRFLLPAMLPQIKATFRIDNATAGLAVTLLWACYALMQFPAGILGDHIGERTVLTGSLVASAVSLLVIAVAPLFAVFLVAAGLFGLSSGLYGPTRGTVVSDTFPHNDGTAFGVLLAAGSIGAALLPLLAGLYVDAVGWRVLVGVAAPAFLLLAVVAWRIVPRRVADGGHSVGAGVRAIPQAISDRGVLIAVAAVTLMLFVFQGLTAFLPTYLIDEKGFTQATAAALFAALFVSGAGAQLVAGKAADRYGDRPVLVAISALGALTVGLLPVLQAFLPLVVLVLGLGTRSAVAPVANSYITTDRPRGRRRMPAIAT